MPRVWIGLGALMVPIMVAVRALQGREQVLEERKLSDERAAVRQQATSALEQEGKVFGANVDERGCMLEIMRRAEHVPGFASSTDGGGFARGCASASKHSEVFCLGVPTVVGVAQNTEQRQKARMWRKEQCEPLGIKELPCAELLLPIQGRCEQNKS